MTCGVYVIQHTASGRCYVGSSSSVERRWSTHRAELRRGSHHSSYLQRAWTKYGADAFTFSIVEHCAIELLAEREQSWMGGLQACVPSRGFNLQPTARSTRGYRHTPEALQKIREAARRRCDDPAHRRMLSERASRQWAEGRIHPGAMTDERRANISKALKGHRSFR